MLAPLLKPDPENVVIPKGTRTVFHSCTYAGRSYEDLAMQINVIRKLKSIFGGSVYDPQEEKYAYVKNTIPRLSPAEKRYGLVYAHFRDNLGQAMFAADDINPKFANYRQINEELSTFDKACVTNNLIAVFL